MPLYEYRCRTCDYTATYPDRGMEGSCPRCSYPDFKRVWGFRMATVVHEHFNPVHGVVISDRKKLDRWYADKEREMSERTGMEHRYVEVDIKDTDHLGVTSEGLGSTFDARPEEKRTGSWL